jgi:hypothetical protein
LRVIFRGGPSTRNTVLQVYTSCERKSGVSSRETCWKV